MNLDRQVCSRARLTRDARFDGKFFIAVLSTGIYCRPICPSRSSKESNVRYYRTAAAAAEAGFRPCLRCRPECSPGTPAWLGTPSTVSRALRLISEGGLEEGGVELLAERLGVGSRHLRRLFLRHLGATPSAVAQTRRLHFAKKLIDETRLPMKEVAMAAGFGCVRRFNAAIRKVYRRPPTELRELAKHAAMLPDNQYLFHLRYRPPYHWKAMLEFLKAHAVPGIETVEGDCWRRTISMKGADGYLAVSQDKEEDSLNLRLGFDDPRMLYAISERVRRMFDLNADWSAIVGSLRGDPLMSERLKAGMGVRVPGAWDGFELAVRALLGEHIAPTGPYEILGRLAERFGKGVSPCGGVSRLFPTAAVLAKCDLTAIGATRVQAKAVGLLAQAVASEEIRFEGMADADLLMARLGELPGMRRSTLSYIAMRALGDTDAFPTEPGTWDELERRAEAWRPWRTYAAMYLWGMERGSELGGLANASD